MLTRGILNNGKEISFALGLEIGSYRGLQIVEHGGALFGYRTEVLRFPEQRFTVLCLCNLSSTDPSSLSRKVAEVYLEKALQAPEITPQRQDAGGFSNHGLFAGEYLSTNAHSVISFEDPNGSLTVRGANLRSIGPNRFESPSKSVIAFDSSNGTMRVRIERGGEVIFAGTRIERVHLVGADLAEYPGAYASKELDATCKISVENGSLILRNNWNPPLKLVPLVRDEFESGDLGTLVFRRDANDRIVGLSVFDYRIRNLIFEKTN
jgi:hypothetical protein